MLAGLAKKRSTLLFLCKSNGIMGTFLLAKEGINGTISGNRCGVETILNYIRSWKGIEDLEVKYSTSQHQNFNRMKVKVKKEIVTMGEPDIDVVSNAGIDCDLAGVNLRKAYHRNADFIGTNLTEANLSKADLWSADFSRADISGAKST